MLGMVYGFCDVGLAAVVWQKQRARRLSVMTSNLPPGPYESPVKCCARFIAWALHEGLCEGVCAQGHESRSI